MVKQKLPIEIGLNEVSDSDNSQRVPLAQSRRLHCCCGDLVPLLVVVIQPEIVFESVGADDVVSSVRKAKDDPAGGVYLTRDRLKPNGDVHVGIRTPRCNDDVKIILQSVLNQYPLPAGRVLGLLHTPATIDRFPPFNALLLKVKFFDVTTRYLKLTKFFARLFLAPGRGAVKQQNRCNYQEKCIDLSHLGSFRISFVTAFSSKVLVEIIEDCCTACKTGLVVFVAHSYASDDTIDSRSFLARKLRVF